LFILSLLILTVSFFFYLFWVDFQSFRSAWGHSLVVFWQIFGYFYSSPMYNIVKNPTMIFVRRQHEAEYRFGFMFFNAAGSLQHNGK